MIKPLAWIATIIFSCVMFLQGCGSDAHGAYSGGGSGGDTAPTAPANLSGNAGDGAVSLGWDVPTTGSTPFTYNVTITPAAAAATISSNGTHALIQGLSNATTYTFSITAKNNAGESTANTILLKPTKIDTPPFNQIKGDVSQPNTPPGISDASLLNESNTLWMVYSSINGYQLSGNTVQDVSTSLAYSDDGGANFSSAPVSTINNSTAGTITPRNTSPCGTITCSGRWVYEMPFMIDDNTDDASKRFKLFTLKYFLFPSATPSASYAFGAIAMKTAASPGSIWSAENVVLSWNSTPQELSATNNINNIDVNLSDCTALIEGAATTYQGSLDFVFACPNAGGTQKIVMLRSTDHAKTFKYISTPLTQADAVALGALYFSAPSLLPTESNSPVLIATPVMNRAINNSTGNVDNQDAYSGCKVFPFADEETGSLFRNNGTPIFILEIPYTTNHLNGACAWDRGVGVSGILMNDFDASMSAPFSILNTAKRL